jgi:hypothetical protein
MARICHKVDAAKKNPRPTFEPPSALPQFQLNLVETVATMIPNRHHP